MNVYRSARKQVGNRVVVTEGGAIPPIPTPLPLSTWLLDIYFKDGKKVFSTPCIFASFILVYR
jgi:hypothetical protein